MNEKSKKTEKETEKPEQTIAQSLLEEEEEEEEEDDDDDDGGGGGGGGVVKSVYRFCE
jgi:hypothetical protein